MGFGGVNFMTCQRLMNIDTLGGARHHRLVVFVPAYIII